MGLALPNGGIGNFLHLILQSYGYTAFQTILIGLPQAAMQVVFPLSGAYVARCFPGWRIYVMMLWMLPSLIGVIIQYSTRNSGALRTCPVGILLTVSLWILHSWLIRCPPGSLLCCSRRQHHRIHQTDDGGSYGVHFLRCRQHHWAASVSTLVYRGYR